jgi:hypothetical protein
LAEIPRKQVANIMTHLSIVSQVMRAENVWLLQLSRKCHGDADLIWAERGYVLGTRLQNLHHMLLADAMVWGKKMLSGMRPVHRVE